MSGHNTKYIHFIIHHFTPAQTNSTKSGNGLWYGSTRLNSAGVKTTLVGYCRNVNLVYIELEKCLIFHLDVFQSSDCVKTEITKQAAKLEKLIVGRPSPGGFGFSHNKGQYLFKYICIVCGSTWHTFYHLLSLM